MLMIINTRRENFKRGGQKMPIYCYKCKNCGTHTEIFQRHIDETKKYTCEECGGELEKVMAPAAVIFKGSGFYTTDYNHGSNSTHTSTKTETKAETKTETKAESKPATPAPATATA